MYCRQPKKTLPNKSTDVTLASNSDTKYPTEKATKTYVDAVSSTGSTALAAEVTRATDAENLIAANLATETTERANADATIITNLNDEINRATTAEGTLSANIALKEDAVNKSTAIALGNSDVLFPTQNAVKSYVDGSVNLATASYLPLSGGNLTGNLNGTTAGFTGDVIMGNNIEKTSPALKLVGYAAAGTTGGGGLEIGDGGAVNMRIYRKPTNQFNISTTASFFPISRYQCR